MKNYIITMIMCAICWHLSGQGVSIGTNDPHSSAALEVSSVTQGMLVPRMTSSQRSMITNPAQGLLVFDLTSNSFWFRNASNWTELIDSVNSVFHRNSPTTIYSAATDSVSIGISEPQSRLHVNGNTYINGQLGIGTAAPHAQLQFDNDPLNRKIVMNEVINNDHQFNGIGGSADEQRYQIHATTANHIFYAGTSSSTSDELFKIKGTGDVVIKGIIESENWIVPTLLLGWINYGSVYSGVGYFKDKMGFVHLRGLIKNGTLGTIFTLPVGYRPTSGRLIIPIIANGESGDAALGRLDVEANGNVVIFEGSSIWTSLSGVSFRAE